jgi:hypothetical protein
VSLCKICCREKHEFWGRYYTHIMLKYSLSKKRSQHLGDSSIACIDLVGLRIVSASCSVGASGIAGLDAIVAGLSLGTSEMTSVITRAGKAAAASFPP